MPLTHLPIPLLRTAIKIREKIDSLTAELMSLVRDEEKATRGRKPAAKAAVPGRKGKRVLSADARAKIAAAQRRRWAKAKGGKASSPAKAAKAKRGKRVLSAEAREKIAAAQRRRWAKARRG